MRTARQILAHARTIAVVGASHDPLKASHWVPKMLQEQGWRIIPVTLHADRLFGERVYGRLADIPVHVDVVDVFRPAGEAPELVRQAAAIGAGAVWLQLGITSPRARQLAAEAGLDYVEDTCIGMERTLAQMVVGGITPACPVYHGIVPQPEPVAVAGVAGCTGPGPARRPLRRQGSGHAGHRGGRRRSVRWRLHPAHNTTPPLTRRTNTDAG